MSTIQERIAKIHLMHASLPSGGLIECVCGRDMLTVTEHAQHVAEVLTTELGLTEEVSVRVGHLSGCVMSPHDVEPRHTVIARRYLTKWETA